MIISDLEILEVVEVSNVQGGLLPPYTYYQNDFVSINFDTTNTFTTTINDPENVGNNSAAAGAKAQARNFTFFPTYSYAKADTVAVPDYLGGSFASSTSAAVINGIR
ncbi:hypothetical protein H6G74_03700 [Nostoc spongiaeforme FACHB-130]|uniref:Uncharacterized protein n=1 Tax=Nostoc spongiaeforme FACHB-130 TaxID=1357510 RepID=A0ABR8FQF7_9NOSO|nr:hypothetical protein [Nostoc spongiaeforme]MBD2593432.1 hypothetical protein [Nostoc spongiaeforme FACHB-130]